jgi:uncharacterized protein YaiL (DUF2058 family)
MSISLRDQLLQLGFKTPPKPEPPPRAAHPAGGGKPAPRNEGRHAAKPGPRRDERGAAPKQRRDGPRRSQAEIDLGKAYALRAQQEKEERIAAEKARQEAARLRREARARLVAFAADKALNDPAAEIARHFEYGGKIKRIYVTPDQLRALNAGELGALQLEGRYVLVTAAVLDEAAQIFPDAVALRVDPDAAPGDDPYADPRYRVPDDLVW